MVPLSDGAFDLDDYIDYLISILHALGGETHVVAVCQPAVPVLAATSVMEARGDVYAPLSMTLMGGPIDTRINPTAVNHMAEGKSLDWFRDNAVMKVPFPHAGFLRDVYPGFLQLSGFMGMNLDRHLTAHKEFFRHLVAGDGDSQAKHVDFYDEYLAVMDLTAEFYLQTVDTVFIRHALPRGRMMHRDVPVEPAAIRNVALLTIEGENDDISGVGQTEAAQRLCSTIPGDMRAHYMQPGVGHYGVFNGSRFRAEIAPRIGDFILTHNRRTAPSFVPAPRRSAAPATEPRAMPGERSAEKPPAKREALSGIVLAEPAGAADDLKRIIGVGPKLETTLNALGIFHFWQLAALSEAQQRELDDRLAFRGRVARDRWIEQAAGLMGERAAVS
jgi:poly(3-hydroxybutyrate) depolymerase